MAMTWPSGSIQVPIQHLLRQGEGPPTVDLLPGQIAVGDVSAGGDQAMYYVCGDGTKVAIRDGLSTVQGNWPLSDYGTY